MSAGCIKKKTDRVAIVKRAKDSLEEALKILRKYPDPDKAPREIEKACSLVRRAIGPNYPDGPIHQEDGRLDYSAVMQEGEENPPEHWVIGLDWLLEHYFS